MILSWGKFLLETTPSVGGAPAASAVWKAIDTPKDGTTKLNTTAGTTIEALEEGGGVVDSRTAANKYTFEFDLFVKKGVAAPFDDIDGVIAGEHCFRLTPEDPTATGFVIDRATIRVEQTFSSADGQILHYVVTALKPKTGKVVKPYTKGG